MLIYQGKENLYDNIIKVDWKLNYQCNYNCSYCFRHGKKRPYIEPTKDDINIAISNLLSIKSKYIILLSGGEPLLYKNIYYLIDQLKKLNISYVQITTNASFSYSDYKLLINDELSYIFYLSIHPEYVDYGHILELVEKLRTHKNIRIHLALMCCKEKMSVISYFMQNIPDGITHNLVFLRKAPLFERLDTYDVSLVSDLYKINKKYPLIYQSYVWKYKDKSIKNIDPTIALFEDRCNYRGLFCCHGSSVLRIEQDGKCKGAICKYAQPSDFSIYQANIFKFNFIKPVRCSADNCGCRDNLVIPKFKNGKEALGYCGDIRSRLIGD